MTTAARVRKTEIALTYSVTTRTVDNWMKTGKIPYFKIGKIVRFDPTKVAEALARFEIGR